MGQADLIGITMGCPVGIGPEIILKFLADFPAGSQFLPVVIGDPRVLAKWSTELAIEAEINTWRPGDTFQAGAVNVCPAPELYDPRLTLNDEDLCWGRPNRQTGRAMAAYIEYAFGLIGSGDIKAMVTCPITKSALHGAGYQYPGHTEMLASLCRTKEYAMMMAGGSLRVTLATIHLALADVPKKLTRESILKLIDLTALSLKNDFGIKAPRLGVAGLNPHAGEGGMFGSEEEELITPAIEAAAKRGLQVSGPFPPDTIFNQAVAGKFDAVVCMYHDQGLIPFKLLHFSDGVNVTIGLPIVRTSVDHGTAYDIVGKGLADHASLKAAFFMAADIVVNRWEAV